MDTFIKIYVLISLWFWAGMLLSAPLRMAFDDMHWRMLGRIYNATWGQVVKAFRTIKLYIKNRTQAFRVSIARSLVGEDVLQDLMRYNVVSAIATARNLGSWNFGVSVDEFYDLLNLATNKPIDRTTMASGVVTAFKVCDTTIFDQIVSQVPRAQERILLAFDQLEGRPPYDSIKNEDYRKFLRD